MEKVSNQAAVVLLLVFCFSTVVESKDLREIVNNWGNGVRCEKICLPVIPWLGHGPVIIPPTIEPKPGTVSDSEPNSTLSTKPEIVSSPPTYISEAVTSRPPDVSTTASSVTSPESRQHVKAHKSDKEKVKYLEKKDFHSVLNKYQHYHKERVNERFLPTQFIPNNCIIICCNSCLPPFGGGPVPIVPIPIDAEEKEPVTVKSEPEERNKGPNKH